jgi:hypothetical protein
MRARHSIDTSKLLDLRLPGYNVSNYMRSHSQQ